MARAYYEAGAPRPTPPREYAIPTVEFGEYVTHKTPTARRDDTLLGKVTGYLSEMLFWADIEGKCRFIDLLIPEWPVIGVLDNIFINIFKRHYEKNYQKQYNRGADQGNKIHSTVFGWIDDTKDMLMGQINEAKKKIETELINPIRAKLRPIEVRVGQMMYRVADAEKRVKEFQDRINDAFDNLKTHTDYIEELFSRVKALEEERADLLKIPQIREWLKI